MKIKYLPLLSVIFWLAGLGLAGAQHMGMQPMLPHVEGQNGQFHRNESFSSRSSLHNSLRSNSGSNVTRRDNFRGDVDRDDRRGVDRGRILDRDHDRRSIVVFGGSYPYYYYPPYPPYYYSYSTPNDYPMLTIADIIDMVSRQVPDDIIINNITNSGSIFHLSPDDIHYLKTHNVSDRVIYYMTATER